MKKIILGVSMLLVSASCYAQALWQEAEVGMSIEEVSEMFPDASTPTKIDVFGNGSSKALLEIPSYQVGQDNFEVQFIFADERLKSVRMQLVDGSPRVSFNHVERLLKTKYGEPLDTNVDSISYSTTWLDDGTTITLSNVLDKLIIMYRADDTTEANKL